jgi:hypothetical protein
MERNLLEIAREVAKREKEKQGQTFDGHPVKQILWETPRMVIFRDDKGDLWRRVHSWGMTWPVVIERARQ